MTPDIPDSSKRRREISAPSDGLQLEEWNFSECPEGEVEYCCYYEYARESHGVKKIVANRRVTKTWKSGLHPRDWAFYETAWFNNFFEPLEGFPDTPWLKLDQARRAEVRERCSRYKGPFQDVGPERLELDPESPVPYIPDDTGGGSSHTIQVVEIDWTSSDDAIKTSFANWIAANRPPDSIVFSKRGRVTDRELLKYLGAFRLLRAFKNDWNRAAEWASAHDTARMGAPNYSDQSGWIRARKNAECMIRNKTLLSPAIGLFKQLDKLSFTVGENARLRAIAGQLTRKEQGKLMLEAKRGDIAALRERLAPKRVH